MIHTCGLRIWEAEAYWSLQDQGQPGLQSEVQAIQGYTVRLSLKTNKGINK